MLKIMDIHTYYGNSYILQGISMDVGKGQVIGIIGRNGMGKTTLVRSIIGFSPPSRGRVVYGDSDITHMKPFNIAKLGISIVPQGRQIFSSLNVIENLMVCFRGRPSGWGLEAVYELFPPLKLRAHHSGGMLSGGEQQMLAIGRSLMTNPSLILMDEPTEGLSPVFVQTVGGIIQRLQQGGISILLVEQNLQFAVTHTEHIHILSRGRIVHSSSPGDLDQNQDVKLRFLGV